MVEVSGIVILKWITDERLVIPIEAARVGMLDVPAKLQYMDSLKEFQRRYFSS